MSEVIESSEALPEVFDGMPSPEKVRQLESFVLSLPQVDLKTDHVVFGGMCARTIFIKAGTVITGAQTNIGNLCVMVGDISVTTDEGTKRLTGFHVLSAEAGFKRAGYAHADTYWTTIWPTDLTDIEQIEDEMTEESAMLQTRREGITYEEPERLVA